MTEAKRNRLLLLMCFLAYSISYIGKYSYSTNVQNVISTLGITKAQAGYASSAFFFAYGVGQLLNGILCEKMNSKWTISLSLILSALITGAMFFLTNVAVMAVVWGLNGLILSVLWSHCIKLLATIRDKAYTAKSITVMSATVPVGVVLAYGCSTVFTFLKAWQWNYLFSAGLLFAIGVLFFILVGKTERGSEREEVVEEKKAEAPQGGKTIFQKFGIMVLPLFLVCLCTGLVRDGATTWLPVLLKDTYDLPDYFSILLTVGLPLMGVFTAAISNGLMNRTKKVFGCCLFAGLFALAMGIVLTFAYDASFVLLILLFMGLSMAGYVLGNVLTSILPLYYKEELKSGQTAGLINACIYLGSTLSSFCLGGLVDGFGWRTFMVFMFVCAVVITGSSLLGLKGDRAQKR